MISNFIRLIRLRHYGHLGKLKFFSALHFYLSVALVFLPLYFIPLMDEVQKTFKLQSAPTVLVGLKVVAWIIAVMSGLNIIREYFLSRSQIVELGYKREMVAQLLNFLIDIYGWKGTCRATLFVPNEKLTEIRPFGRITGGVGAGKEGKAFFKIGQGLPGKAWESAWAGEELESLADAVEVGNVPPVVLANPDQLRSFFKETFCVKDHKIYESLGEKKFRIQSYMAVGILGRFKKLECVLVIDSEQPDKFADFEQLRLAKRGRMMTEEKGMAIFSHEHNAKEGTGQSAPIPPMPMPMDFLENLPEELRKTLDEKEWPEAQRRLKSMRVAWHMACAGDARIDTQSFHFPLAWALRQAKEILTLY